MSASKHPLENHPHHAFTALVAALATLLSSTAAAAPAVKVYGRIDNSISITKYHDSGDVTQRLNSGYIGGSRFGIRATERLSSDTKVEVVLENGFNADDGTFVTDGTLFSRQSTLALENKTWGEIAFGRSGKVMSGSNAYTRINGFTPFAVLWGDAGLLFYGKGARINNGIYYQSPELSNFTLTASGSLSTSDDEVAPWSANERYFGATLDYKREHWGVLLGADRTVLAAEDRAAGSDNPTTTLLMGYVDAGEVRLYAAWQHAENLSRLSALKTQKTETGTTIKVVNASANNFMLGAKAPLLGGTLRLSALYSANRNEGNFRRLSTNRADYWALGLGYEYPLSKSTRLYGALTHIEGRHALKHATSASEGDLNRSSMTFGLSHTF